VNIAYQLYGVLELLEQDAQGTVERLADAGYDAVEFVGTPSNEYRTDRTLPTLGPVFGEHGIRIVSAHLTIDELQGAEPPFADLRDRGCEFAIVAWVPPELRDSVARVKELAATINRAAAAAQEHGLRFCYHNHAFEFEPLEGTTIFEVFGAELDPDLVSFELDAYWLVRGGLDAAEEIKSRAGRVPLVHLKDMANDARHWVGNRVQGTGEEERRTFVPIGTGFFDWSSLLEATRAAGVEWHVVEQDYSPSPLEDAELSLRNLRELAGVAV
jgi:sugar phosphate isomerase/epimerase